MFLCVERAACELTRRFSRYLSGGAKGCINEDKIRSPGEGVPRTSGVHSADSIRNANSSLLSNSIDTPIFGEDAESAALFAPGWCVMSYAPLKRLARRAAAAIYGLGGPGDKSDEAPSPPPLLIAANPPRSLFAHVRKGGPKALLPEAKLRNEHYCRRCRIQSR